ncbi:histidine kinase [Striga asiatica]|uniref:Histidine kinase n=1 Tax=Striga asiatica TaxID=4170 RepID=A0A5A7RBQ3_STRAF|nr:histidine kinase [Striga asiatica]
MLSFKFRNLEFIWEIAGCEALVSVEALFLFFVLMFSVRLLWPPKFFNALRVKRSVCRKSEVEEAEGPTERKLLAGKKILMVDVWSYRAEVAYGFLLMNWVEKTRRIREVEEVYGFRVPIIALTASEGEETGEDGSGWGG